MKAPRWIPKRRPAGAEASVEKPKTTREKKAPRTALPGLNEGTGLERVTSWLATKGWAPHAFQRETWTAYARGESGVVHVPTGAGKTYAAYLGALADLIDRNETSADGLKLLYITPLRAVSRDVELALQAPVEALGLPMRIESRTGDTRETTKAKQRKALPSVLITTPESLSLLIATSQAPEAFSNVHGVLIDEWHELLGTKRGTQVELALARIRSFSPQVRTWAMTA
ncbi:MAG: DEAD/DEAH box helicase, partial [Polyangiaceae bacterium]